MKVEAIEQLKKELPEELHGVEEYMKLAEEAWESGDHISAEMLMQIAGDEHDHAKYIMHLADHHNITVDPVMKTKFHELEHKMMKHYK